MRCKTCGVIKGKNSFTYSPYYKRRLFKCKSCVKSSRRLKKKQRLEEIKRYGISSQVEKNIEKRARSRAEKEVNSKLNALLCQKFLPRLKVYNSIFPYILIAHFWVIPYLFMASTNPEKLKFYEVLSILALVDTLWFLGTSSIRRLKHVKESLVTKRYFKYLRVLTKDRKETPKFYSTSEWRDLRIIFITKMKKNGKLTCSYCNVSMRECTVHVDHIKPRSVHPELAMDLNNLAISCHKCNSSKGAKSLSAWSLVSP